MITSSEIGMLIEFWNKLSNFVPAKDKSDAANSFVALLDDYGIDDQSINELKENDEHLEEAFEEYYQECMQTARALIALYGLEIAVRAGDDGPMLTAARAAGRCCLR